MRAPVGAAHGLQLALNALHGDVEILRRPRPSAPNRCRARRRAPRPTRPESSASAGRPVAAAAARAFSSALPMKVVSVSSGSGRSELGRRDHLDAVGRQQLGDLARLAGIVAGDDELRAGEAARALGASDLTMRRQGFSADHNVGSSISGRKPIAGVECSRLVVGLVFGGTAQRLHGEELGSAVAHQAFALRQQAPADAAAVLLRADADGVDLPGAGALLPQSDEADRRPLLDGDQHRQLRRFPRELHQRRLDGEPIRQCPQDALADRDLSRASGASMAITVSAIPEIRRGPTCAFAGPPAAPRRAWPAPAWRRTLRR